MGTTLPLHRSMYLSRRVLALHAGGLGINPQHLHIFCLSRLLPVGYGAGRALHRPLPKTLVLPGGMAGPGVWGTAVVHSGCYTPCQPLELPHSSCPAPSCSDWGGTTGRPQRALHLQRKTGQALTKTTNPLGMRPTSPHILRWKHTPNLHCWALWHHCPGLA